MTKNVEEEVEDLVRRLHLYLYVFRRWVIRCRGSGYGASWDMGGENEPRQPLTLTYDLLSLM